MAAAPGVDRPFSVQVDSSARATRERLRIRRGSARPSHVHSASAREVQLTRAALAKLAPIRAQKVQVLRRGILGGRYVVDAGDLAEDMLGTSTATQ